VTAANPPSPIVWRALLSRTAPRTRALACVVALALVAARLFAVATALEVAHGDARGAALLGALAGGAFVVQRIVAGAARVHAECDLYGAATRALLDTDVLGVPAEDPQRVVFESNHVGRNVIAGALPNLGADVVASVVLVPVLGSHFPLRVLALGAVALFVVLATVLALRRATMRLQDGVLRASERVADGMIAAIEGRLELVARGGEGAFARTYEQTLREYARIATRASLGSAALGRAPLFMGTAVVASIVAIDASSREALATTVLGEALLLAAAMPAVLGVVVGAHELARSARVVMPLVAILEAPRRPDLDRRGGLAPAVPAPISIERVTFVYDSERAPVLADVSAEWTTGRPLVVAGPNGGGKSTLLRLVLGLRPASAGTIRVGELELGGVDLGALRRRVAYLPQRPYLGEAYHSIKSALQFACADATDAAMVAAVGRAGLGARLAAENDPLGVRLGTLSAGQRQRIALARILLQNAPVVLLDEPDANLDQDGVKLVADIVLELVAAGKMVLLAAHAPELMALSPAPLHLGPRR
jgi:ABC-type bacteriocin/lantibiotic exporter with double-glycine peptidase domain